MHDLQYILVLLAYMLNLSQEFAHFSYFNQVLTVQLNCSAADFEEKINLLETLLQRRFSVDDFAVISRREVFLGVA